MKISLLNFMVFSSLFIVSCSEENKISEIEVESKSLVKRDIDLHAFSRGQRLFQKNCAACHGKYGEGAKGWRKPDKNGKNLAPPLNGTGHTWHHSNESLTQTIKNGTAKIGGNMPAWKDKLSNGEIKLILSWITAQWPDEIYTAWYNRFHQK